MRLPITAQILVAGAALLLLPALVIADEGMWLFNNPPRKILKDKYQFDASAAWLDHLQKSAVRFDSGGSGSFVSANGMVMTNHHVASDCIQKISSAGKDYIQTGFEAPAQAQEAKCPDLELNVLESMEDVTARVNAAVKPGQDAAAVQKARRAVINTIEKESQDKTGLRSDVVTLYDGGEYQLYRYKKYTDVRLVFAPEKAIAAFGGDPDNFEYPRYDLDIAFFRVYENNQPVQVKDYLKWNSQGPKDGDLIFIPGNPGSTSRLDTVRHLEYLRDRSNPYIMNWLFRREVLLRTYSDRSIENARRAEDDLLSYQNSRKAYLGMQGGLQNPALMDQKRADEKKLRDAVLHDPKLREADGGAWDQVASTIDVMQGIFINLDLLEGGRAFDSGLFDIARTLVRLAEESRKPNGERLREYAESQLDSLKQQLFSEAPIYDDLEIAKLADSLSMYAGIEGGDQELVRKVLAGKSPSDRAAELIQGTRLKDVAVRKQLAEGGVAAIEASTDPMIQLARLVDPPSRDLRKIYDEKVAEPRRQAYGKISSARFALYGTNVYPDATFTLRLAFGEVKGYQEAGKQIPWNTTLGGTYDRAAQHDSMPPFNLPQRWIERKSSLNLSTPFNFVNTADIIGGNSGSPVVDRNGDLVGIVFDGNLQSLVLDYTYTDQEARAVAVDSAAILEALRKVYGANWLLTELIGTK
ncbi:MAG: S46 family peptidase [Bryobacteraceae bacterium]